MRVSLRWLEDYVRVDVPVEKLVELLDMTGLKVEAIHRPGASTRGVVVAEVVEVLPHPDADNLVLVEVQADGDSRDMVVSGVRNFEPGDRVPLATVGARVGAMEVGERKIRGVVSKGMLCSAAELGVSKDHSGILVLAPDAPLGADVVPLLGLDDTILELEITPNRPDCMSMIGIAREVSVILRNELEVPDIDLEASEELSSPVTVDVQDAVRCPRYLARYIEGVTVERSPSWLASRLLSAGLRPISNVVDVTNYVLLEMGHPLHPFDAAKIRGQGIVVRRARRGERLETLDGVERELHPDDLLIADRKRALGIAGVMGGADSEVSDDTTAVVLESAYFDRASIAFTSRRHLLRTEASARFERGADPEVVPRAAARAAQLMSEVADGRVAAKEVDAYPRPLERRRIRLRPSRTNALLGMDIAPRAQASYLRGLGLAVTENERVVEVDVPGFRPDLEREADLVEEVARLAGYERLPSTLPPGRTGRLEPAQRAERRLRRILAGFGLREAWTTSFSSQADVDALGFASNHPGRRMVTLANPTSAEENALRTTLAPGLLRSAARNVAHRADGVALFEVARVYEPTGQELPREALVVGAVFCGSRLRAMWNRPAARWDFFSVKGVVEATFASLGAPAPAFQPAAGMPFHPTRAARVSLDGTTLGALGELHPDVCARFDVPEGALLFELALAGILSALPGRVRAGDLPRFPSVYLDLAVVVDDSVPARKVEELIREVGAPELVSVRLFDLYRGPQVASGKKSLAYALEFRSDERTLTEEEAMGVRDRIVDALQRQVDARLRT